jgi:hypothetical protein
MCHTAIRSCGHSHYQSPNTPTPIQHILVLHNMLFSTPFGGASARFATSPPSISDAATALAAASSSLSKAAEAMAEAALAMCDASDVFDALNIFAEALALIDSVGSDVGGRSVDGSVESEAEDVPEEVGLEAIMNYMSADDDDNIRE